MRASRWSEPRSPPMTSPTGRTATLPRPGAGLPTNSDEAHALAQFGGAESDRAVLVANTRVGDNYTDSLREAFQTLLKDARYEPQLFTSPEVPTDEGTTSNTFRQITHLICDTDAETVFFAGRHTQLRQFINALGNRGCRDRAVTVLTGDEGSYLGGDRKLDLNALKAKLTVRYTSLAHPERGRRMRAPGCRRPVAPPRTTSGS
ncbi:hypothetical protein NKH18_22465 [Streptomyces sp. M10(2022)]